MEYRKTKAITINRQNFRESSQLVSLYTRDYGKISCLARGARKLRSDFEGPFDLLSYGQVTYIYQPTNSLYLITGAKVYDNFPNLRENYPLGRAGVYLADFIGKMTPLEDKNHKLFDLLRETLEAINRAKRLDNFAVFSFEAQALKFLGYLPYPANCAHCGKEIVPDRSGQAFFSAHYRGLACAACRDKTYQMDDQMFFPVRFDVIRLLNTLAGGKVSFERLRASPPALKELRLFINRYIARIADRELIWAGEPS